MLEDYFLKAELLNSHMYPP